MLLIFTTAVNAVMPIILLILLGYLLRQKNFLSGEFVRIGNKLVFNVCLPAMLFVAVYDIDGFGSIEWDVVIYACVMVAVLFAVGIAAAVLTTPEPARRGVINQCVFRSNYAIIGLSLAAALGGEEAQAIGAVVSAFTVPIFNILAVVALSMYGVQGQKRSVKSVLLNIAKNPLILSVLAGFVCLAIREVQLHLWGEAVFTMKQDVKFLYTALSNLKNIASPFALIVLGGQFVFSAVRSLLKEIAVGVLGRTVLAPVVGLGLAVLLGKLGVVQFDQNAYPALIALFGSPVAVSSAIMAGQMGNDEQLATQLVVWTSLVSIVTIFAQVCVLMAMGLLAV